MSSAASSESTSGRAVTGSGVIHRDSEDRVRSAPEAAARNTSRSVRIPATDRPSRTTAEPNPPLTMVAATSATVVSGGALNTSDVMISVSATIAHSGRSGGSSAFAAYFVDIWVGHRRRGDGEVGVELTPQRPGPRAEPRPGSPEHLQDRVVETCGRLIGRDLVGHALEC